METSGDRLKMFRKKHLNMSRESFVKPLGVSVSVLRNIEDNRLANVNNLSPIFQAISQSYKVSYKWLVDGTGDMYEERTSNEQIIDYMDKVLHTSEGSIERNLIVAFSKLSPEQWDNVKTFIKSIIE